MMITNLPGHRLLIDIFDKLVYLFDCERYRVVPIYIFLCIVLVTLRRMMIGVHTNTYMLDDQPFLIDSTTFLSQCNRMTITGFYL